MTEHEHEQPYDERWEVFKGRWEAAHPEIKAEWSELSDADLAEIAGDHDRLVAKLADRYQLSRDDARLRLDAWIERAWWQWEKRVQ